MQILRKPESIRFSIFGWAATVLASGEGYPITANNAPNGSPLRIAITKIGRSNVSNFKQVGSK
jgi:hypothetical protein